MYFALILLLLAQPPPTENALLTTLKAGRYAEALRMTLPLIQAEPHNPRLWTARGLAHRGLGHAVEALGDFERALKISPKYLPALEGAAETAYATRDPRTARLLKTVLELEPANETAHAMSGVVAFEAKDCTGALSHFEKSRNAIVENEVALSQFGTCLISTGHSAEAADAFARALALNPSDAATRYNLGLSQSMAGLNTAAISTLEPLLGHCDFETDVLNLLAAAYASGGRIQDAIRALHKATEISPKDERNYLDLAVLCMEHQVPDLALDMAGAGLQNIPNSAALYAIRGAIYATMDRTENAAADFEAAERLMPEQLYGSVGQSLLFQQTNQPNRSVAVLRERLRRDPNDPTLNFLLADTLLRLSADVNSPQLMEARSALLRSVAAKPDFAKAHAELGKIYLKGGEPEKAMKELRLALELDPRDRIALQQLLIALHRLNDTKEASAVAATLRTLIWQDQEEERQRNRFSLLKAPPLREAMH
jgi:tetratricopeptide (TPR) repeat protein